MYRMTMTVALGAAIAAQSAIAGLAMAGEPEVVSAVIELTGRSTYSVHATVRHADEGWDHYADKWDVVAADGTVLATRVLLHPHVDEQPFTRSQTKIVIPSEIEQVTVRAHDSVHGYGTKTVTLKVPH